MTTPPAGTVRCGFVACELPAEREVLTPQGWAPACGIHRVGRQARTTAMPA